MTKQLNIAIIALGFLGDTLLVEPMVRNIRNNYPESRIVLIVNKVFADIAKGFRGIDVIYDYDKKDKNKGIKNCFSSRPEYAVITHPHDRSTFVAKYIRAKNIISVPAKSSFCNFLINKKVYCSDEEKSRTYKTDYNLKYLEGWCEKIESYPARYIRDDINSSEIIKKFNLPDKYLVLSPISKDVIKDWDYANVKSFISEAMLPVALVGTQKANDIAQRLKDENVDFIDLTNKTNITELGEVIKRSEACISVDTGTFHFSYVQNVKTVGLFFHKEKIKAWVPQNLDCIKIVESPDYRLVLDALFKF